jgi:hypothetical protein
MAVHRPQGGGARGGDQQPFPCSLDFYGGGTTPPAAVTWRCTVLLVEVYTAPSVASLGSSSSLSRPGGHRPAS